MDFFQEVLITVLAKEEVSVTFPNLKFKVSELLEIKCFDVLQKIKTIIEDDSLSDAECFKQIEEIVCVLEEIGSNGGNRHDFG